VPLQLSEGAKGGALEKSAYQAELEKARALMRQVGHCHFLSQRSQTLIVRFATCASLYWSRRGSWALSWVSAGSAPLMLRGGQGACRN
jgi:hypothetical protein